MSISGLDDDLLYEKKGKLAYMTFNRPSEMNSITPQMLEDLDRIADDFNNDNELLVLIVTGAGEQSFCAGADLKKTITKLTEDADKGRSEEHTSELQSLSGWRYRNFTGHGYSRCRRARPLWPARSALGDYPRRWLPRAIASPNPLLPRHGYSAYRPPNYR